MGLPERYSLSVPAQDPRDGPPAINPNIILVIRFLLTSLVCGLALATTIMCLLVVVYYNSHDPIIRPSWGSLIYLIVLGFFTCIIYFGYNIFLPLMPFIRYGDFLYSLFMVKLELLLQFAFCVLWVSGALAYASDLRGYENCQFDGYYHYPKPADFNHVCDLINWAVPLAYATFGVQVLLWFFETSFGLYTFLLLDQESFNEPHFAWGRRAYDWKHNSSAHRGSTGSNTYRARAVAAGAGGAAAGAAAGERGSPNGNGRGRRGAAYNDPEAAENQDEEYGYAHGQDGESELAEEMTESEHGQSRGPLALGRRGRRGYADEESVGSGGTADGRSQGHERGDSEAWHLRE
ncbi:hypothetical protein BDZ90DRAFT_277396 [Jaminaea rosea]|uniref:MARVEL domain-containing protein n=1 Tax=Jaminaea rosea TaxID=1569628 RepID=A0A316V369_9BASI|nr:hypothetical protein BDZ90DRAFT_277396 [Jaminaea rosea]PWN30981.1 hypothetical protein BDZ90DRAFT_277396 [Jaminaea rosea]